MMTNELFEREWNYLFEQRSREYNNLSATRKIQINNITYTTYSDTVPPHVTSYEEAMMMCIFIIPDTRFEEFSTVLEKQLYLELT